jgi:threonine/homoserine/homoserine lactone efflux protein
MTSLIGIGLTSFLVALSGALMPGPLLTTTVGESSRYGPRAGPLLIAGHALLEFLLVVALFLGLAPLLTNKKVTAGISIAGSAILLWLAFDMARTLSTLVLHYAGSPQRQHRRLITAGILVSLSNPYWSIWWATIGLAYVLQSQRHGIIGVAFFFTGHILADLAWYSFISFSVGKSRRFFSTTIYRGLAGFCALFLIGFSLWFLWNGLKNIGWF